MDLMRARAALVALVLLVFAPSLGGELVYDDVALVRDDARVAAGDLRAAVTTPYWGARHGGLYRPLTTLSYVAQARVSRAPIAFRAVNLVLHAGATLVAFELARRILGPGRGAWLAAALFAVHPIHVEVAANVVGRAESLGFLLGGAAWWLTVEAVRRERRGALVLACGLATLAVLAKENGFSVALGAPLELIVFGPRRARALVASLAPATASLAIGVALRVAALGPSALTPASVGVVEFMNPLVHAPLAVRLANVPVLLVHYGKNLVAPVALGPDYGGELLSLAKGPGDARALGAAAGVGAVLGAALLLARRRGACVLALGFLLLALAPVLQVVPIGTIAADRLAYAASFGFALVAGDGLARAARSGRGRMGVALVLGALAAIATSYARDWTDGVRLFETARARTRGSVQVPLNLGKIRLLRDEPRLAREPLAEAVQLAPREPEPLLLLARAERLVGRPGIAQVALERALALHPADEATYRSELGLALLEADDPAGAEDQLARAAALPPEDARTLAILGQLRARRGDVAGARSALRRSLELDPSQERAADVRKLLESLPDDREKR